MQKSANAASLHTRLGHKNVSLGEAASSLATLFSSHLFGSTTCGESPFYLEGRGGLFEFTEQRLKENGHLVTVAVEKVGQEYVA